MYLSHAEKVALTSFDQGPWLRAEEIRVPWYAIRSWVILSLLRKGKIHIRNSLNRKMSGIIIQATDGSHIGSVKVGGVEQTVPLYCLSERKTCPYCQEEL